jgi:hypothetical protein
MSVPPQDSAPEQEQTAGQPPEQPAVPTAVRRLTSPAALALADLAAVLEDLQTSLRCCERLMAELQSNGSGPDDLALEAFWTTAVLSYARCFAPGPRGVGLTEDDVTATGLPGEVLGWHRALLQVRDRLADPATNPRESFTVGASQGATGHAEGVALASTRAGGVDEVSVRQTGAIAFALSRLVDERITAQQDVVFSAVAAMARPALDNLALVQLTHSDAAPGGAR